MSSLFAKYIKEREGKTVIETDDVLAIYKFDLDHNSVYIEDIYVVPEKRKSGLGQKVADFICNLGRKQGLKYLVGSVVPSANGSDYSLKLLLRYGMRLKSSHENIIFLIKDL
jgi:ribosomal protein S18 acetylase RimI-like enzyme